MAKNTQRKENFNDYKEYMKVFEDLFKMPREEFIAERDSANKAIELAQEIAEEIEKLEEYFEELDKKEVLTQEEKLKRRVKEERYKQLKEVEAKMEKRISRVDFVSELERYSVFIKVKEPLKIARDVLEKARKSKDEKMKAANKSLKDAEKDLESLEKLYGSETEQLDTEFIELEEYFIEYTKRNIILNKDRLEYEEKKKRYEEIKEIKDKMSNSRKKVEEAKENLDEIKYHAEENEIMKNARKQIKFMTDKSNWKQILTMSKEELMSKLNEKEIPSEDKKEEEGKEQEEAETKPEEEKGKDKKETPVITAGVARTGEAPVAADRDEDNEEELDKEEDDDKEEDEGEKTEEELKDLTDPKRSIWGRIKETFTKRFGRNKGKSKKRVIKTTRETKKDKREKRLEEYIKKYIEVNHKEPSKFEQGLAKYLPNLLPQVRNILDGTEAKLQVNYAKTQAGPLLEKVRAAKQELEKVEGEIVRPEEKTSAAREIIDQSEELDRIDKFEDRLRIIKPVINDTVGYEDRVSEEPKRVKAVIKVDPNYAGAELGESTDRQKLAQRFREQINRQAQGAGVNPINNGIVADSNVNRGQEEAVNTANDEHDGRD